MKLNTFLLMILVVISTNLNAQVIVSDDHNYTGHPSALIDLHSKTGGLLGPRLNTVEMNSIVNPASGLMVFNTDSSAYCVYNGFDWKVVKGNTLDGAYDEGLAPGAGRLINADAGPVQIHSRFEAFKVFDIDTLNYTHKNLVEFQIKRPGNGLFVWHDHNGNAIHAVNSHSGTALTAVNSGLGHAGKFETTTNLNTEPAVLIVNKGSNHALEVDQEDDEGSAGSFTNFNADNLDPVIEVDNKGKGDGIEVWQHENAGSAVNLRTFHMNNLDPSLYVVNEGKGDGVEVNQIGNSGSAANLFIENNNNLDPVLFVDNDGKGSGIEVFQNKNQGSAASLTNFHVNNLDPVLYVDNEGKGDGIEVYQRGIDGSAGYFINEHFNSIFPTVFVNNIGHGDGLIAESEKAVGVTGESNSNNFTHAGVLGIGMGDKDKAAAIDVHNGAITVSGQNRPAGRANLNFAWIPIGDADDWDIIGYYTINTIQNTLIDGDRSVITLTPHIPFDLPFTVDILSVADGSVTIKIGCMGVFDMLPSSGQVHYHIINDNG